MSLSKEDLIQFFISGNKPSDQHKIGMEYEFFGFLNSLGDPLPFYSEPGVESTLKKIADLDGWEKELENNRVIRLKKEGKSIFLEPGGQFELSTLPHKKLKDLHKEILQVMELLGRLSEREGVSWGAFGIHPLCLLDQVEWIPKERYKIMSRYFEKHGSECAHHMMKQTASIQINIDYKNEADAFFKFRLLTAIAPVITAIFANSSIYEGFVIPFESYRSYIWQHTDPVRCGLIKEVFDPAFTFERYIDWISHVPMLFIKRGDEWIEVLDRNFSQFMEKGYAGYEAEIEDWSLHLSTIFTEVRLKQVIELRSADSQKPEMAMGLAALINGLLFNQETLQAAWACVQNWSWEDLLHLYENVPKLGLRSTIKNDKISITAGELVRISKIGLSQKEKMYQLKGETDFLLPIEERLKKGVSLAGERVKLFKKDPESWLKTGKLGK